MTQWDQDSRTTPGPASRTPRSGIMGTAGALAAMFAVALLATAPAAAADLATAPAQPSAPPPSPSDWQFQATLYGWATGINGDIGIRRLPTFPVDATFGDVLSHLDGTLMGSFVAKKDEWTLFADLFWAKLGVSSTVPVANFPQVDIDQRLLIVQTVAGYRLPVGGPGFDLSATAGLRYQRLTVNSTLTTFAIPFVYSEHDVKQWADPVFGLALQWRINDKWFFNALADVGGFDISGGSKLTSQGFAAIGYNWTASWSTALGYRALYTDYRSETGPDHDFRYTTTLHGPFMSIAYHF